MTTLFANSRCLAGTWIVIKALSCWAWQRCASGLRPPSICGHTPQNLDARPDEHVRSARGDGHVAAMAAGHSCGVEGGDVALAGNAIELTFVDSAAAAPEAHDALSTSDAIGVFAVPVCRNRRHLSWCSRVSAVPGQQRRALRHLCSFPTIVNDADWIAR